VSFTSILSMDVQQRTLDAGASGATPRKVTVQLATILGEAVRQSRDRVHG
jgi:hypothetical protein